MLFLSNNNDATVDGEKMLSFQFIHRKYFLSRKRRWKVPRPVQLLQVYSLFQRHPLTKVLSSWFDVQQNSEDVWLAWEHSLPRLACHVPRDRVLTISISKQVGQYITEVLYFYLMKALCYRFPGPKTVSLSAIDNNRGFRASIKLWSHSLSFISMCIFLFPFF